LRVVARLKPIDERRPAMLPARPTVRAPFHCVILLCLGGCTAAVGNSPAAPSEGGSGMQPVAHSCVFQTRRVQHCGGASPEGDWVAHCNDGPCPSWLDAHLISFDDGLGDTCDEVSAYQNVIDFEGTCDSWMNAGEPLTHPTQLYCGESLLYNEFDTGTDAFGDCESCLQSHCAIGYAACYPSLHKSSRCDDLIRCMRKCPAGDGAGADACTQQFSDVVAAANEFVACTVQRCASTCN
jgi:hypothetical protein